MKSSFILSTEPKASAALSGMMGERGITVTGDFSVASVDGARKVLKAYDIGLGFAPVGHKQFEGDGKTPEGQYFISHKNPDSQYHLSLGISYPNEADIAFAEAEGKSPGGDIFIHGGPNTRVSKRDWTWGCIALTDKEIERVYSMVKPGTPVFILP